MSRLVCESGTRCESILVVNSGAKVRHWPSLPLSDSDCADECVKVFIVGVDRSCRVAGAALRQKFTHELKEASGFTSLSYVGA